MNKKNQNSHPYHLNSHHGHLEQDLKGDIKNMNFNMLDNSTLVSPPVALERVRTHLDNFQHQGLIFLVYDAMLDQHFVDHWDKDLVLLSQLQD